MSEVIRDYNEFARWLSARGLKSLFVVCGNSFANIAPGRFLDCLAAVGFTITYFKDFTPNPDHSSVVKGIEAFKASGADTLIGAGGGSAMDVAKAIKLEGEFKIPFAAIPTTAGTGSEATRFAVIYDNGTKTSLTSDLMLPDVVLIDPSVLEGLPEYQKKATMSDAVCHAVESAWSAATCEESRKFSYSALDKIFANYKAYLEGDDKTFGIMMDAAFEAGEAINITKTTGGHALCYKLTTKYGLAHGHAALLCVNALWDFMDGKTDNLKFLADYRAQFKEYYDHLGLAKPEIEQADYDVLADSVNLDRLSNTPVALTHEDIVKIYQGL